MLEFKNFSKTYQNGTRAVADLDLTVPAGQIFGFIGHNGAGKTTAIRCAVGALDFQGGDIFVDSVSVREQPIECKRRIAYIPDNPDIYEHLTGRRYAQFVCDIFGVPKNERDAALEKYAARLEMTAHMDEYISSYSHGMKQKAAIIAALCHSPKLLVLDEPFVGLDPKAAHTVKGIMRELCDNGSAIFFSTHVLDVAEKLCDSIAIIKSGRLIACGTTDEVRGNSSLEDVFLELTEQ